MNPHVLRHDLRVSLRFLLTLSLGVFVFAVLMTAMYPSMKDSFDDMLKAIPSFMKPMVQARMGMNTVEGFVTVAFVHPVMLALLASWPLSRGSEAIAGEIERGTLGWMLSYPIGRLPFLAAKAAVLLLGCAVLPLVFVGGVWSTLAVLEIPHMGLAVYLQAAFMTFLLYGALGTLTLWCSAAFSERGPASLVGTAFLLVNFLWDYAAELWAPIKPYKFLSIFDYYDPKAVLYGNGLQPRELAVLGGLMLVTLVGAAMTFRRRDLSI